MTTLPSVSDRVHGLDSKEVQSFEGNDAGGCECSILQAFVSFRIEPIRPRINPSPYGNRLSYEVVKGQTCYFIKPGNCFILLGFSCF